MKLDELLDASLAQAASDILLSPGSRPALRIQGALVYVSPTVLTADAVWGAVRALLSPARVHELETALGCDAAVAYRDARFRLSAYFRDGVPALAMRRIPSTIPTPAQLGLPPVVLELIQRPQGLLLFTGAAGQGKSTTQASLIDLLNRTTQRHIITVEDPVEFVHPSRSSIVDQREVGRDTRSFADALRHALRQDPDVLLVGEMRDHETISAAITIAETGHLVLATLHTNDAVQAIHRVLDVFPGEAQAQVRNQLSLALVAVVSQRLLPGRGGALVLAAEVLFNTPAVASLIRENKLEQLYTAMEIDTRSGMQTMNRALEDLVARDALDPEVAARFASTRESGSVHGAAGGHGHTDRPPAR